MIEGGHQYQWLTAYNRQRMDGHCLDWPGQPSFFKDYSPCSSYPLPLPEVFPEGSLFSFLKKAACSGHLSAKSSPPFVWNRLSLATLLLLTSAPTARSSFAEGEVWYRSNASAGALHPLEFYLSFPGSADLAAGIYHYDLLKPGLNRLRHDPSLASFAVACGLHENEDSLSPTLVISGIFFRSAWKYCNRAYRYLLLDAGHALENLSLALSSLGSDFDIVLDFNDALINQLLGFDDQREVSLVAVRLPSVSILLGCQPLLEEADPEPELESRSRVSAREVGYPWLNEMHQVSSVPLLRSTACKRVPPEIFQEVSKWQEIPEDIIFPKSAFNYVESLRRRRSKRNFSKSGISLTLDNFFLLLDAMTIKETDNFSPEPEIAVMAEGVSGLNDGLYFFDRFAGRFALIDERKRHHEVAAAALDQRWLERAALQVLFFADLGSVSESFGPRSYRYLHIAAGRLGQRLYLGAAALGLGCCAVGAFYDRELGRLYRLPENCDPLYLVAVGPVVAPK